MCVLRFFDLVHKHNSYCIVCMLVLYLHNDGVDTIFSTMRIWRDARRDRQEGVQYFQKANILPPFFCLSGGGGCTLYGWAWRIGNGSWPPKDEPTHTLSPKFNLKLC